MSDNRERKKWKKGSWMLTVMTPEAQEQRRIYKNKYRQRNRDKINQQQRAWRADNPEKVREYQKRYWEKRAKNPRASWEDYGITKERYRQLTEYIQSGKYTLMVRQAAHTANKDIAEYILLSVTENLSYDELQKMWELKKIERMACGRSDFYGYRRLFFYYLDLALKGEEIG